MIMFGVRIYFIGLHFSSLHIFSFLLQHLLLKSDQCSNMTSMIKRVDKTRLELKIYLIDKQAWRSGGQGWRSKMADAARIIGVGRKGKSGRVSSTEPYRAGLMRRESIP